MHLRLHHLRHSVAVQGASPLRTSVGIMSEATCLPEPDYYESLTRVQHRACPRIFGGGCDWSSSSAFFASRAEVLLLIVQNVLREGWLMFAQVENV